MGVIHWIDLKSRWKWKGGKWSARKVEKFAALKILLSTVALGHDVHHIVKFSATFLVKTKWEF